MSPWPISVTLSRQVSLASSFFFLPFLFSFYYLLVSSSHCLIPARRPQRQYRPIFHFIRCPLRRSLFPHLPLPFVCLFALHSPSASIIVCHTLSTLSPRGHVWPSYLFWPFKAFIRMFQLSLFSCLLEVLHQCASFDKYLDSRRD